MSDPGFAQDEVRAATGADTLICTYSPAASIVMALFSLPFIGFGIYALANRETIPFRSNGVLMPMPIWFPFIFMLAGFAVFGYGIYLAARAKNESITVMNGTITWTSANGQVRLKCGYSDVRAGSFQVITSRNRGAMSGTSTMPLAYSVNTVHGVLKWTKDIKFCDDLNGLMQRLSSWEVSDRVLPQTPQAASPQTMKLLCTYPKKPAYILVGFGAFVFFGSILVPIFAPQLGLGASPPWPTMITSVLFGAFFLGYGCYLLMSAQSEHIAISNETITWMGPTAKVKLMCSFKDINPGGFQTRTGNRGQVYGYSLQTTRGMIKWGRSINHCDDLNALIHEITRDSVRT